MLTGTELLQKIKSLGQVPMETAAEACGYVTAEGKVKAKAFSAALNEAHGLTFTKPVGGNRQGKALSYKAKTGANGGAVIGGGYLALIGVEPGSQVTIEHVGETIVLSAAVAK